MGLSIGSPAPGFSLLGVDGRTYSYADVAGTQATVVLFWCNHCPYVVPNQDRVIRMQAQYAARGVRFTAICANNPAAYPEDDYEHMVKRAQDKGYNFPYLHDPGQETARAYGAQRTPEVFVFDAGGRLRYHGRIDDNHQDEAQAVSHDLRDALDALLDGKLPEVEETGAYGCSIKWNPAQTQTAR
jgi:peroxiredoxin